MTINAIIWKDKTITYKINNNKIITTKINNNDKTKKRNMQTLDR